MRIITGLVVGLVCGLIGSMAQAAEAGPRTLSFEDRVNAQRTIERVYYGHQIGATKPFDQVVPRAVIEAKVRLYLEESAALELYWKTPITDEALQRELERMASGTRMPERLQEIYAVLGNDTSLIKECVARATLADRLTHNFYAFDPRYHAAARAAIDALREQVTSGALSPKADHPNRTVSTITMDSQGDAPSGPSLDRRVSQAEFDERRGQLAAAGQASPEVESHDAFSFDVVLSEDPTTMRVATYIVPKVTWTAWWSTARTALRADSVVAVALNRTHIPRPAKGSAFDPNGACTGDGWNNGSLDDLPDARAQHSAVWTGSVMLIWGGQSNGYGYPDKGGRYDPVTDSWQSMTTTNAPRGRIQHTAVWTGSEMIVWGGHEQGSDTWFVTGGRYDPIEDRWTAISLGLSARREHTAVWTGKRMIVWGGVVKSGIYDEYLNTGALYDPATDSWTPTAILGAPDGRYGHTAIWTGNRMIVWGGNLRWNGGYPTADGGSYDPSTDTWTLIGFASGAGDGRLHHSAVWTGSLMVVWGGESLVPCSGCPSGQTLGAINTGARYDPALDRWIGISDAGAPPPMYTPLAAWTGHDMLLLANYWDSGGGWRYDPSTDHWTQIAPDGSSNLHVDASLVWTGKLAIAWGGWVVQGRFDTLVNTGRRYDPWSDRWTPTNSSPPSRRSRHTAVWTGNEMLVWGGTAQPDSGYPFAGDRYDPATDSWTGMSTQVSPTPSTGHTAVWTGDEMIVWAGGLPTPGGRYNPRTDAWSTITEAGAPTARIYHAAAWTGHQMVVWGGLGSALEPLQSGGVYDPATDHWTATATVNAPSARQRPTAVWTGSRVVIWGGLSGSAANSSTNTGGQYDPETDTWTATSLTGAPSARPYHSAVWAGGRMVVWGGGSPGSTNFNTGGRYDPSSDTWSPTTIVGAPPPRTGHGAVAAGNLMLTWGGYYGAFAPNTGGIYDVVNDRWTKITKPGEPVPTPVTAVWTGEAMIVWSGISGGRYYLGNSLDDDCDHDGVSAAAGDCDDHDPATYPGAPAHCDGVGNDCGNTYWPLPTNESDYDRDGWLNCAGDCDDNNFYVHPGQAEACDGWDTDCDGQDPALTEADNDRDGYRICRGDCDDSERWINPGAHEQCDALDNDCDGAIDEGGDALCVFNLGCTTGTCSGSDGCTELTHVVGPCDDHEQCTTDDRCQGGNCRGSELNDTPCDDGRACTIGDHCENGRCWYGEFLTCGSDDNDCNGREYCDDRTDACAVLDVLSSCDDGNICTFDSCDPATGCHHVFNVDPCNDGNACTSGDVCSDGLCLAGTADTCDDGNACTDDACVPSEGCVHTNNAASCDDGNACTGWQACEGGACVGHDPVICPAGDQCQDAGACNPTTGVCSFAAKPDGTVCDDSRLCTTGESCQLGTCTPAYSGLNHPAPKSAGYYKKLCQLREHNPSHSHGDELSENDAACVGQLTSTFAGISTVDEVCEVINTDHRPPHGGRHHGGSGDGANGKDCDKGEDELIATALNICRARVCEEQNLDSNCHGNLHTTVSQSFGDADAILDDAGRTKDSCKDARCELREINNGHALEMNSLALARENNSVRLTWTSPVLDDGSGAPSTYELWRRPMGSTDAFVKIGTTSGLTFLDATAGTTAWEYDITAVIPGN